MPTPGGCPNQGVTGKLILGSIPCPNLHKKRRQKDSFQDALERAADEPWLRTTFSTTDFDRRFAFVTLKDSTFYFPDIAKGYRSKQNKEEEAEKKTALKNETESSKTLGIPKFFLQ
uniref:Uncharacterized protein n=1 Tax=Magallana gigas TaxID=29159 RepID=K1QG30_MAGGI